MKRCVAGSNDERRRADRDGSRASVELQLRTFKREDTPTVSGLVAADRSRENIWQGRLFVSIDAPRYLVLSWFHHAIGE